MSLKSKVDQYDTLVDAMFELLDKEDTSELDGRPFKLVHITCCREADRLKLENVLLGLKNTRKDRG